MKTCYIFGGGTAPAAVCDIREEDLVIAADAGLTLCRNFGITPDVILGDFDSLGQIPCTENVIRYPVEKDDTDMAIAVNFGRERGFSRFVLYGGSGGRMDHTMANWQLLSGLASRGMQGFLCGDGFCATVLCQGTLVFPEKCDGILSCFAFDGPCEGVTIQGLQYPLTDAKLMPDRPLGVSNHFVGKAASVTVHAGRMLVMWEGEDLFPQLQKDCANA